MSGNDIHIIRAGNLNCERAVRVLQGNRSLGFVNPTTLVRMATGEYINRRSCIVSFADGLTAAGHDVFMHYMTLSGQYVPVRYMRGDSQVVCVYFLCGLAWVKGEWYSLAQNLVLYVRPEMRLRVLESTAQRYFNDSFSCRFGKLSLVINT